MLIESQIQAGTARLSTGKLVPTDVDQLVSVFRMFLGNLEEVYSYEFRSKLEALDDTEDTDRTAAQVAACIIKMEELGFGVASLSGPVNYKEKDEYSQYVILAFSKIYPIPAELSSWDLKRRTHTRRSSQTAGSYRSENFGGWCADDSERFRRRYR